MKKTVLLSAAFALAFGYAVVAFAAAAPDTVVYDKPKNGAVTFNHKAHATKLGDCAKCHQGTPAKIVINKEAAHGASCKDCHTTMSAPTKCGDCHKK